MYPALVVWREGGEMGAAEKNSFNTGKKEEEEEEYS